MKKATLLLVIFSMIFYTANAGWGGNFRKKCRSWSKKYTAHAHINRTLCGYHYTSHGDCDFAHVNFTKNYCCDVNAEVYADNSASGIHGWFHPACKMTGYELSDLDMALAPDEPQVETPEYALGTNEATVVPAILNNQVNVNNISVLLRSDVNDPRPNTFTVAVWLPQDDTTNGVEDTIYTANKAIAFGTVTLIGGQLSVTGSIFTAIDFNVTQQNGMVTVTYIGENKTITLPVSVNSDYVAVTSFGDIGPNQVAQYRKATETKNGVIVGKLDFNIYPNPANDVINLHSSSPEKKSLTISIYDEVGRLMMKKERIEVNVGETTNAINISGLAPGEYFILAEGADVKTIKTLIKK